MVRRRAPPCFGSAIHAAALRMSSGESPVIFAASSIVVWLRLTASLKPLAGSGVTAWDRVSPAPPVESRSPPVLAAMKP